MPNAGKIIAGAALLAGAVALDVATGGAAGVAGAEEFTAFLGIIGATGTSLVASGIAGVLATPPPGQGVTSTNPIQPWQVAYGNVKVAGTAIYLESNGGILSNGSNTYNKCHNRVIMLASHRIQSVDQVRMNGKAIQLGPGGSGAQNTTWTFSPDTNQSQTNISTISRTAGVATVKLVSGLTGQNGLQFNIQNVADNTFNGIFTVTQPNPLDDTTYTYLCGGPDTGSSGGFILTCFPDYKNRIHCDLTSCLGDHADTFPELLSTSNLWTTDHRNLGKASVYLAFYYDTDVFPGGNIPQSSFVITGKNDIYDPRTDTHGYTNNAALVIADYLSNSTWGFGFQYGTDIPLAQLIAAANICDEAVPLAAGGTEPRYTINMAFDLSRGRGEVLQDMLDACAGRITIQSGQYAIVPGAWVGPSLSLTKDNLVGPVEFKPIMSIRDICNGVKGTYTSPVNNWQSADFPPYAEDVLHQFVADRWLAADNGERIWKDISFPATTSCPTAQRLGKIQLERLRREGRLALHCDASAYPCVALDVIDFTYPRYGWVNKTFEVLKSDLVMRADANGGAPTLGVDLDLAETDSTVYDWGITEELTPADNPSPALSNGQIIAGPQFLELESGPSTSYVGADGIALPRILAAWLSSPDAVVQSGGYVQVEYQRVGDTQWTPAGNVGGTQTQCYINNVVSGFQYNVQVQGFTASGAGSGWAQAGPVTVSSTTTSLVASSVTYPDGTPVADLQPSQAGADVTSLNVPTEMLMNGSFELGLTGWGATAGSPAIDTAQAKYGKQSLKLHGSSIIQSVLVSLKENHVYTIQGWVKTDGSVVGNSSLGAGIYFADPTQTIRVQKTNGTPANDSGIWPAVILAAIVATDWTQIQFTFSVTTDCMLEMAISDCYGSSTTLNANAWFDGISLIDITGGADVTAAQVLVYTGLSANLIPNGNFILGNIDRWAPVVGGAAAPTYFAAVKGLQLGPNSGTQSATFNVNPGQKYRLTFTGAANSFGTNQVYHRIFYSPTYSPNTQVDGSTAFLDFLAAGSIPNTVATYTYDWICPPGIFYASLAMYQTGDVFLYYTNVAAQDYGASAEWGADVTGQNTALSIVDQGALATINQANTSNIIAGAVNSQIVFSNSGVIAAAAFSTTVLAEVTFGTNGGYVKVRATMQCLGKTSGTYPLPSIALWKGASGGTLLKSYGNVFMTRDLSDGGLICIVIEAVDIAPSLAQQYTVTVTCSSVAVECDTITLIAENAKV